MQVRNGALPLFRLRCMPSFCMIWNSGVWHYLGRNWSETMSTHVVFKYWYPQLFIASRFPSCAHPVLYMEPDIQCGALCGEHRTRFQTFSTIVTPGYHLSTFRHNCHACMELWGWQNRVQPVNCVGIQRPWFKQTNNMVKTSWFIVWSTQRFSVVWN